MVIRIPPLPSMIIWLYHGGLAGYTLFSGGLMTLLFDEKPGTNAPAMSVSELSNQLKRTVEDRFGLVRVRGEISQPKLATSGHWYLALKDQDAVLDAVCWRGSAQKLPIKPTEGMEVVCTGRLTTFPGRSKYQMVIESMALAGEGALLKMLADRKKKLLAEGLFVPERKKPLPVLPRVIGVVTSPTGAVIRDILHRLADRFPCHVLVWPVLVQGENAAAQVTAAIEGFNRLAVGGAIPRPDLLIVARGGGSLEDLMAFNEENVVRAAAASTIPLIAAIGHETDTTLIDLAADRRAPTPTAAAEMAVPVRIDLWHRTQELGRRHHLLVHKTLEQAGLRLSMIDQKLGHAVRIFDQQTQRLDVAVERFDRGMLQMIQQRGQHLALLAGRLPSPRQHWQIKYQQSQQVGQKLSQAMTYLRQSAHRHWAQIGTRWQQAPILARVHEHQRRLDDGAARLARIAPYRVQRDQERLDALALRLENVSHHAVLARGYALVRDEHGTPLSRCAEIAHGQRLKIEMSDGVISAEKTG